MLPNVLFHKKRTQDKVHDELSLNLSAEPLESSWWFSRKENYNSFHECPCLRKPLMATLLELMVTLLKLKGQKHTVHLYENLILLT